MQPQHRATLTQPLLTTMRSADTELQNTIELRATVSEIAAPKPNKSRRQSRKKTILKHFLKGFLKGKLLPWKLRKSTRKSLSQPGCSHSNTIYDVQLRKTIVLRMQPQHRATLTQPLLTTMRSADTELQNTIELRATVSKIAAPKPDGSRRQSRKKTILKHFLKGFLKGKLLPWKLRKSADKALSQPGCSHSNTIYDVQLQKTIVLRMQPQHRATLTQPLLTTMRSADTELQNTIELRATVSEIAAPKPNKSRRQSRKKTILKHFLKGFLKGKLLPWKLRKSTRKSLSQPGCSHSNTIYDVQLQKTKVLRMQPRHRATLSTQGVVLRLPPQNIDHATFMQPLQCDLQPQLQETHRTTPQEQPLVAKHIEGTNRVRNDRSRTRRTHEVPFIVACSHFTRKNTRFRAPASSPKHRPCNIHAAMTMRSATTASGNAWNYSTGTTTCCKTHRRNQSRPERPQPHPSHTRGTFHRRLQPLYTEKHKVSCSGFLPTT